MDTGMCANLTVHYDEPQWANKPMFKLPRWAEPMMIVVILFITMFLTRRRGYQVLGRKRGSYQSILDIGSKDMPSTEESLQYDGEMDCDEQPFCVPGKHFSKTRSCIGLFEIHTPNSSRFKHHIHSRLLQKLPFLVEMFYWTITYAAYHYSARTAQALAKGDSIGLVAEAHALSILGFQKCGWIRHFLPCRESTVQQWFIHGHQDALTFLNRSYALIHIPATISFIGWYYYAAPSHSTFATVRRTLTLTNYLAFILFILYPVMPPRLLPKEYGFLDTVHHDDAASVWMSGALINMLAAMPSMHFGYAFAIGSTLIYHSEVLRTRFEAGEIRKNTLWKAFYCMLGVGYPSYILLTILATANHYWLDAVVALLCVVIAFWANRISLVFTPLEDWLLWLLRLEKPRPSTGEQVPARGSML